MSSTGRMREFWDRRAREDPWYFVHTEMKYGNPDEEGFWASGEEALDNLLSHLGAEISAGDHVVEVGCGIGRLTRVIGGRAAAVDAVDVSQAMLDLAREHNPGLENVRWRLGDGTTLSEIGTGAADACISNVVFQHIPDPAVTLGYVAEMGRVLRPGGWAAIQVSNDPGVHRPWRGPGWRRRRLLAALGRAPRGQDHVEWLGSSIDLAELAATAKESGLDIERVIGAGTQYCGVLLRRR